MDMTLALFAGLSTQRSCTMSGLCIVRRSCPTRWRTEFAHGRLTPDGLQHRGMSSKNRGKQTPNHCLMLNKLNLFTLLSREAHAI